MFLIAVKAVLFLT